MPIKENTLSLIDALKSICQTYGMGNDGNEYKIITQVFLYKFLNDKFSYHLKMIKPELARQENWERKYYDMSEEEIFGIFDKLSPDVPKLLPEHLISNLWNQQTKGDFDLIFDQTMVDIADKNMAVFSTQTTQNTKISLFEPLSIFVTDSAQRAPFARALVDKLVSFSFEEAFKEHYDFFAYIFEYLIKDYNTNGGGKYAEYYTPHSIATIMAKLLVSDEQNLRNIECYDPSAGTGTLLMALSHQIGEEKCTIFSQDISQRSNKMLKLNLILNGLVSSLDHVIQGDTLVSPYHKSNDGTQLRQFDFVVSNPPFKMDFSDTRDRIAAMPARFWAGVPNIVPKKIESMPIYTCFVQHVINSLKPTGKGAIVVPTGFTTSKNGVEKSLLKSIIESRLVYGCINMPSNVFANTGTNVSVLLIDNSRNSDKVVLIDASNLGEEYKEGKIKKKRLREFEMNLIIDTFKNKVEVEDFSVVVDYERIIDSNYSLSASQYFYIKSEIIDISKDEFDNVLSSHYKSLTSIFAKIRTLETNVASILNNQIFEFYESETEWNGELKRNIPKGWEVVKIEDCVEHVNTGLNPRNHFVLNNGDIKYVTVKNLLTNGVIDFYGCDTVNQDAKLTIHNRSDISVGDVLFASIAPFGRCHIIKEEPTDWDINESVFSIRPNRDMITSTFLYMIFTSEAFVSKVTSMATGSIFKGIRISDLLNIKIVKPPISFINKLDHSMNEIFGLYTTLEKERLEIEHLQSVLLPMIINGKIRII